jgi:hypothetical protein
MVPSLVGSGGGFNRLALARHGSTGGRIDFWTLDLGSSGDLNL